MSDTEFKRCIIKIPNATYEKLVIISNIMRISVTDLLSQSMNTDAYEEMVNTLYKTALQIASQQKAVKP